MPSSVERGLRKAGLMTGVALVVLGATAAVRDDVRAQEATGTGGPPPRKSQLKISISVDVEINVEMPRGGTPSGAPPAVDVKVTTPTPRVETSRGGILRLGIVDRPGELATREVFYEDRDGRAVMQGDIDIGASKDLNNNLIREMGTLARRVQTRGADKGLAEEKKTALKAVQRLVDAPRAITEASEAPELEELVRAAALLPLDDLQLDGPVRPAINALLARPESKAILDEVETERVSPELGKRLKEDAALRERVKAGLIDLADRVGIRTRGLKPDPVTQSVTTIRGAGPTPDISVDLRRLAALASLAPEDALPADQRDSLRVLAQDAPETIHKVTGDPVLVPAPSEDAIRSVFRPVRRYRWPKGEVPYDIDASIPVGSNLRNMIENDAMNDYRNRTAITFRKRTDKDRDYVMFKIGSMNLSPVGRQGGPQSIQLRTDANTGTIIHEIGHAVGLWHEQARNDRDKYVKILYENLTSRDLARQFDKTGSEGSTFGPYDYGSVMHYFATAFARTGTATIVKSDGTALPDSVGNASRLSDLDIQTGLDIMYGAKGSN